MRHCSAVFLVLMVLAGLPVATEAATVEWRPVAGLPVPLPSRDAAQIEVADLDGDGAPDVAVTEPPGDAVRVLRGPDLGTPPWTLSAPQTPWDLAVGDVAGDGRPELLVGTNGGPSVHVITWSGPLQTLTAPGGCRMGSPVAANVLDDARAELVIVRACAGRPADLSVYAFGAGDARLKQVLEGAGGSRLAVADLDHDGWDDVIAAGDGRVRVAKGAAGGLLPGAETVFGERSAVRDMTAGDVDGDRHADVVVLITNRTGRATTGESPAADPGLAWLRGTGRGGLRTPRGPGFPVAEETYHVAAGDLNGDGRDDVVAPSRTLVPGAVILGGRRGPSHAAGEIRGIDAAVADLDGDGRLGVVSLDTDGPVGMVRGWKAVRVRPGTARLTAPRRCLRSGRLRLRVSGSRITSVVFRVRGGSSRRVAPREGIARYSAGLWRIPRAGTRVRATVTFSTSQRPRTLTARVRRCR